MEVELVAEVGVDFGKLRNFGVAGTDDEGNLLSPAQVPLRSSIPWLTLPVCGLEHN